MQLVRDGSFQGSPFLMLEIMLFICLWISDLWITLEVILRWEMK